ncbi:MAG: AAA family ATPase [Xenococcaceae cyanobacterium]
MNDWRIFEGNRKEPHDAIRDKDRFPDPPKWRRFSIFPKELESQNEEYWKKLQDLAANNERDQERGRKFFIRSSYAKATKGSRSKNQADGDDEHLKEYAKVIDAVNAALYLRRPLLVTGRPGSGKTSLAYAIAYQLKLGPVLLWSITARSTLQEGLYQYDAIARLQEAQLQQTGQPQITPDPNRNPSYTNIGQYIRLGPVGTAFVSSQYPRILLIDEIDKSDINLPNDLLNLFEEGQFDIPELVRLSKQGDKTQVVESADGLDITIAEGKVRCCAFPVVVMTSNGERDFPPAFLRRCLRIRIPDPDKDDLKEIVKSHLEDEGIFRTFKTSIENSIADYMKEQNNQEGNLATDQLLNLVYLLTHKAEDDLKEILFKPLTSAEDER